jgi:hypothetical protein
MCQPGSCLELQPIKGRQDVAGMAGNAMLVNSGFHKRKNLSENCPQVRHASEKKFHQPCPRPKKFQNVFFKGGPKLLTCPVCPPMYWTIPDCYNVSKYNYQDLFMQISRIMYLAGQLHKFHIICDTLLSRMIH